ncbi:hypothetical protein COTS27_01175 [Spirochaetota bacterium]|nr:hypothetical protein COTS27_01175 [Spirochaetota bacterium]
MMQSHSYKIAVAQFAIETDRASNIARALKFVDWAAELKADLLLLPELFEFPYFPRVRSPHYFQWSSSLADHPYIDVFQAKAKKYQLALPFSFFEHAQGKFYNTLAFITKKGTVAGSYRKMHIPHGIGYEEEYYFSPGVEKKPHSNHSHSATQSPITDSLDNPTKTPLAQHVFPVWHTEKAAIGTAICWDQWFPEPARIMAIKGADFLLYPSAIGSEPIVPQGIEDIERMDAHNNSNNINHSNNTSHSNNASNMQEREYLQHSSFHSPERPVNGNHSYCRYSSKFHWQQVMCGHAAANMLPVAAANRIGYEGPSHKPTATAEQHTKNTFHHADDPPLIFYGSSFITNHEGRIVAKLGETEPGIIAYTFDVGALRKFRAHWGLMDDRRPDLYASLLSS